MQDEVVKEYRAVVIFRGGGKYDAVTRDGGYFAATGKSSAQALTALGEKILKKNPAAESICANGLRLRLRGGGS